MKLKKKFQSLIMRYFLLWFYGSWFASEVGGMLVKPEAVVRGVLMKPEVVAIERWTELGVTVRGMLVKPETVIRGVLVKPEAVTRAG